MSYHRFAPSHFSGLGAFSDADVMGQGCSASSLPRGEERALVEQILQTHVDETAQRATCSGPNAGMCRASVAGGFAKKRAGLREQLEALCGAKAAAAAAAAYQSSMQAAAAAQAESTSRTTTRTKFGPATPAPSAAPALAPEETAPAELAPVRQPQPEPLVSNRTLLFVGIGVAALGVVYLVVR